MVMSTGVSLLRTAQSLLTGRTIICCKIVVLLSFHLIAPIVGGDFEFGTDVLSFVFLVSRDCYVTLPRGAMGLSGVCDCGIS